MADDNLTGAADSFSETSAPSALEFTVERVLNRRGTMTMVKVVRAPYNAQDQDIAQGATGAVGYIDVQPLVNQLDGAGKAVPHGTVYGVPYVRYQGGGNAVINDPVFGDKGLMFIAHEDLSSVKATGAQANPGSRRRGAYEDGIFLGVVNGGADPSQYMSFTAHGIDIKDKNNNVIQMGEGGVLINGALITPAGDVVTKHGTSLDHHVNTLVTTGSGESGPPP